MPENKDDLQLPVSLSNKGIDYLVATLRAAASGIPVPWVGSAIAEWITVAIPNQRMDRIADYAHRLAEKLADFEKSFLDEQAKRSDFCELIEESFHQAARSTTDDRRQYVANLITTGLREDQHDYLKARFLLRILGQLNDAEILILCHYSIQYPAAATEFARNNPGLFGPWISGKNETPEAEAIRKGYNEHLADLGLLDREYKTEGDSYSDFRRTSVDANDVRDALEAISKSAKVVVSNLNISELGRLLLKFILEPKSSDATTQVNSSDTPPPEVPPPWR